MIRVLVRTAVAAAAVAVLATVTAGPAAAYYDPAKPGWPPKPTIPQSTSVAIDVVDTDTNGPSYWTMVDNIGVSAGGNATLYGNPGRNSFGTIVSTPTGKGYWVVNTSNGGVESYGDAWKAPSFATTGFSRYTATDYLSDASATPDGQGLVAVDTAGHVWTLGTARAYGDVTKGPTCQRFEGVGPVAIRYNQDASGYTIVGALGEVWVRGSNVAVHGDACSIGQQHTITSMALTPDHNGYWLVDYQGNVYPHGDAQANMTGTLTNKNSPVTYMAARPTGGYLLVHQNGAVDVFSPGTTTSPPRHHCCPRGSHRCPR